MKHKSLNAQQLKAMFAAGAVMLERHKQEINSLNVFPVPDGDTGTNMNLTVQAAGKEMAKPGTDSIRQVAEALAMGSLMGARGNSGVILSQLFRGLSKGLTEAQEVTPAIFAAALQLGVDTAYKAVIKPVEGTILTVAKASARIAVRKARECQDLNSLMEYVIGEARLTLEKTPEMLPVLKQAGVVDAGGMGLCYIYEGWLNYLEGRAELPAQVVTEYARTEQVEAAEGLAFTYCTEFIVTGQNLREDVFRRGLTGQGDSLLVVGTSGLIKIHIHTNQPGEVLNFALEHGEELQDIKIENMRLQHTEVAQQQQQVQTPAEQLSKRTGVIAVASGQGLEEIFKSMGVDEVVVGGQTMNPSTEDFLRAIAALAAEQVVILPNNSNIILAAQQAQELADKKVAVIPTKTIPQGLAAMLNYSPDGEDLEDMVAAMTRSSSAVKTGQVTFAVRDSVFDGQPIAEGNILGLAEGKIVVVGEDVADTARQLATKLVDEDAEVITLFFGEDVSSAEAEALASELAEAYPECEVEVYSGGQPLYFYIIAVE